MKSGIYLISMGLLGPYYVGQARNIERRWASHRLHLSLGRHSNAALQRLYWAGRQPRFSVLWHCPRCQLNALEALWGRLIPTVEQRLPRLRWGSFLPALSLDTVWFWGWMGVLYCVWRLW